MTQKHTSSSVQEWLGYLFPDEIDALKELANMLPKNPTVVNIGAGGGTSGLAFLESRPDLFLITIDVQRETSPYGCLAGEETVLRSAGYWATGRNEQIWGDSKVIGRAWYKGKVDFVFVDGDHSFEGCSGDIINWLPHIKNGGIIAVHDYNKKHIFANGNYKDVKTPAPSPWKGVDKAVNELLIDKYTEVLRIDSLIAFEVK